MRKIKNNWKVALIVAVGIIAIILLGVFCIQSSQNRAFILEEQVNTADSDIKVQEKRRVEFRKWIEVLPYSEIIIGKAMGIKHDSIL